MTRPSVAVVGAGITGLAFASALIDEISGRGLDAEVRLIESSPLAGGQARTVIEDGWVVESGPNGYLDREPEAAALVSQLGLAGRVVEASATSRRRFIVRNGRLLRVPASPQAFITSDSLSWRGKLRILREPWSPRPPMDVDETVFAFAERRIGREAAETFVDTIVSGISGGDSRSLSLRSQFPVLHEWESAHGSLVRAAFAQRKKAGGRKRLISFDRGLGVLTSALAARLRDRTTTGVAVKAIESQDGGWRLRLADGSFHSADHVVFATAAHVTASLVRSTAANLATALSAIPYAGLAVVALAFPREALRRPLDGYGYLVPRTEGLATLGVLWESAIFPNRAPGDGALLRVVLGGALRPDVLALDEKEIASIAQRELGAVLGLTAQPSRRWVFRWPKAIAQYTVGHAERLSAISAELASKPGLGVCGTAYDGVSFTSAIASARKSARDLGARLSRQ